MNFGAVRSVALRRGFSLVEICVVLALTGIVATLAWPSLQSQLQRSRRADGVAALLRVQMAQESYRAHHGLYATQLAALRGASASHSAEGLYDIEMAGDGITRYEALARARPGSPVAGDRDCAVLRLQVRDGQAEFAPSRQCWNR
jgi:type IV pilus assembly protein PilE